MILRIYPDWHFLKRLDYVEQNICKENNQAYTERNCY